MSCRKLGLEDELHISLFYLQTPHSEIHKKNSVRHKLVSLTLKKKSKITEEVRSSPKIKTYTCDMMQN